MIGFDLFRFIEHLVEHLCRFATQPTKSESDFNIQTTQTTGVVSELRSLSDDAIEISVRFAEEQDGRENTEYVPYSILYTMRGYI